MKNLLAAVALVLLAVTCHAQIRLPKILGNNMVLQRNKPITLWGWANPKEKITVEFNKQRKSVQADASGNWKVALSPESAGGPFQLSFKGKNVITLNNILVGEVWVCSGQSNMEWPVAQAKNASQEIKDANYPQIRQFLVQKSVSSKPEVDVKGGDWKICSPETAGNFTAVGYFFARELYNQLKVPIGLINTSWGGTHSETWTSKEAFEQSAEFKEMIAGMPVLDLEVLAKKRNEELMAKLKGMNIILPSSGSEQWKELSFDDSKWNTMTLPGQWEQKGLTDVDGIIWFRKSVMISAGDASKEGTLELGMIDDSDETFVNGTKVGATKNKYNEQRLYKIPAGVLKEGKNIIAVRVEDYGGGGGIYGDAKNLKLTLSRNTFFMLDGDWLFNIESLPAGTSTIGPNTYPTLLFNAMLNPLTNFSIEGVIWYQGESNAGRAYQYRSAFPLMITDWREHFNQGDFPFYFVQLASFNSANGNSERGSTWAELREAQTMTLSLPNTDMTVTTDIGENDLHPRNKQDVGKRLAAIAMNKVYGSDKVYSGPMYQSMKVEGSKIRIAFSQIGSGLLVKDKYGYVKGFEIAGADKKFYYAQARIEGNEVIVFADAVATPVAVRFAWEDNPEDANLFNKEGFPACPFRTDAWKGITQESRFLIK